MNEPLISVIVPVYKTDVDLLRRCVNSVLGQTYRNHEILLVLNGNTPEYDEKIGLLFPDVTVIKAETVGLSHARNVGLSRANGRFIAFVDSDDEVVPDYLEKALNVMKETDADVAVGGFRYQFDGYADFLKYTGKTRILRGTDVLHPMLTAGTKNARTLNGYLFYSACGKLFRKEVFEKTFFNENVFFCEDFLFGFSAAAEGVTYALTDEIWYVYYQYSDSLLHAKRENDPALQSFAVIFRAVNDIIAEKSLEEALLGDFGGFLTYNIVFCMSRADRYRTFRYFFKDCCRNTLFVKAQTAYFSVSEEKKRFDQRCIRHRLPFPLYCVSKIKSRKANIRHSENKPDKLIGDE